MQLIHSINEIEKNDNKPLHLIYYFNIIILRLLLQLHIHFLEIQKNNLVTKQYQIPIMNTLLNNSEELLILRF